MLFGFLLALPFTVRFQQLNHAERGFYMTSLLGAALAIALLIAPVAFHRWVFRLHEKELLLRVANAMVLVGLAMVALAMTSSVLLVMSFIAAGWLAALVVATTCASLVVLWFVVPILSRRHVPSPPPRG